MKKILAYILSVACLCSVMLGLSACGDDKEKDVKEYSEPVTQEQVETQTVYVIVTGDDGNPSTNAEGYGSTQISYVTATKTTKATKATKKKKQKTNKTTFTYAVKGGTDPYVEDPFN